MPKGTKECPECGHPFKGNEWVGIDAHWKANHEHLMPYKEVWPKLKGGTYRSSKQSTRSDKE